MAVIDDIVVIQMQRPGIDGTGITSPEKAQLVNDVAEALARANITSLMAVPGVNGSPSNGDVLVYAGSGNWEPAPLASGISSISDRGVGPISTNAVTMEFAEGLTVTASETGGTVYPAVVFGGTGSASAAARVDHTHTLRADVALPFDASGTLSSSSRTLVPTTTISGLDAARTYVISGRLAGDLRGGGTGAGYTLPRIIIAGEARDRFNGSRGEVRTVSGVDRDYSMEHPGVTVSGVTSVAVGATLAYRSGDPIIVGAGELTISIKANR